MLCAILNWVKKIITDTCEAHIKQGLHEATCKIIGTDVYSGYHRYACIPLGAMMFHLMDYGILGIHLYGSAELNFLFGCFWAVALHSFRDIQQAGCRHFWYSLIMKCTTGLFVLAL